MTLNYNEATGKLDVVLTLVEHTHIRQGTEIGISLQKTIDMTRECIFYESGEVPDVNRIFSVGSELPVSWDRDADRMGGKFTDEEIRNSTEWR